MRYLFTVTTMLCLGQLQAQTGDSAFYAQSIAHVYNNYKEFAGNYLHIYNGTEYIRTGHGVKGTAFFLSEDLLPGSVFFDGRKYDDLLLHYDLVTDNLILKNYNQGNELVLVPEKVSTFIIGGHLFVRLDADSARPDFIRTGFYEKLYDGYAVVFAKRSKVQKRTMLTTENAIYLDYKEYDDYFMLYKGMFYKADDKSQLLDIAGSRKSDLKKFIRDKNLNFKKDREASLITVAAWFSQLKN